MKRGPTTQKAKQPFKKPRVASKPAKPANQLFAAKSKLGPELKNIDETNTVALTAGSLQFSAAQDLNIISQGATAETRIGRKIVMTSLEIRWTWSLAIGAVGGSPLRILVVYDKQANAAAPAITDILATNSFLGLMNLANSERFVILVSQILEPISTGNNISVGGTIYRSMRLETVFNDTNGGTIGDIQTGSVTMWFAQDGQVTTANPTVGYNTRVRFEDA